MRPKSNARSRRAWQIGGLAASVCAVAVVFATSAPSLTACTAHVCDPADVCIYPPRLGHPEYDFGTCDPNVATPAGLDAGYRPSAVSVPLANGGAEILWQSSPMDGPWLDFRGMRFFHIALPSSPDFLDPNVPAIPFDCTVSTPVFYVSSDNPTEAGVGHMNVVIAAGELAEFNMTVGSPYGFSPDGAIFDPAWQFNILNPTCADYALRITATFECPPPSTTDAGEAPASDAADTHADGAVTDGGDAVADASLTDGGTLDAEPSVLDAGASSD